MLVVVFASLKEKNCEKNNPQDPCSKLRSEFLCFLHTVCDAVPFVAVVVVLCCFVAVVANAGTCR